MVHQRLIDFGQYETKSVLETFFIIFCVSLSIKKHRTPVLRLVTVIKLELSCDRLHVNFPGGLVRCFLGVQ